MHSPTHALPPSFTRNHSVTLSLTFLRAEFDYQKFQFTVVDVGGQKSERRKWINFFDNVNVSNQLKNQPTKQPINQLSYQPINQLSDQTINQLSGQPNRRLSDQLMSIN